MLPMTPEEKPRRIKSIDILRGFVMVVMTLDHARDFLGDAFYPATDLTQSNFLVFMTRWITHLCAPTFLLLAGSSIWFQFQKGDVRSVRRFVVARGLVLVLLDTSIIHLVWYYHMDMRFAVAGVIWATGWAMVLMGMMIGTPRWMVLIIGAALLIFQPFLAGLLPDAPWAYLLIRTEDIIWMTGWHFYTSYPVLPWFGILSIGYFLGSWFLEQEANRNRKLLLTGVLMIVSFMILRSWTSIGNPESWIKFDTVWQTALSFINLEKYPPSLDYCLITIGISLLLFVLLGKLPDVLGRIFSVLGSAPLMYYIAHIFLLHLFAIIYSFIVFGRTNFLLHGPEIFWYDHLQGHPDGYGISLPAVYVVTVLVIILLFPFIRWYSFYKKSHPNTAWRFL